MRWFANYSGDAFASSLNVAVSTSVVTSDATVYNPVKSGTAAGHTGAACAAFVSVETNTIRYTVDGSTPTSANGHAVAAGGSFWVYGSANVANLKMIRASADAVVQITYFRELI